MCCIPICWSSMEYAASNGGILSGVVKMAGATDSGAQEPFTLRRQNGLLVEKQDRSVYSMV